MFQEGEAPPAVITLDQKDLDFLNCGQCGKLVSPYSNPHHQRACANGQFLCDNCTRCKCGKSTRDIAEIDPITSRTAWYYVKHLIHTCPDCGWFHRDAYVMALHRLVSCRKSVETMDYKQHEQHNRIFAKTNDRGVARIEPHRNLVSVNIETSYGDIVLDAETLKMNIDQKMKEPVYIVIQPDDDLSKDWIWYGIVTPKEIASLKHTVPIKARPFTLRVFPVFEEIPADPTSIIRYKDMRHSCTESITAWKDYITARLDQECLDACAEGREFRAITTLLKPVGCGWEAKGDSKMRAFEYIARLYQGKDFSGGVYFEVPGIIYKDERDGRPREMETFILFLFDSVFKNETLTICPCCWGWFKLHTIYEHLGIQEEYIRNYARRFDIETDRLITIEHVPTKCAQLVRGASYSHEALPAAMRVAMDMMPIASHRIQAYNDSPSLLPKDIFGGIFFVEKCRPRFVAVYLESVVKENPWDDAVSSIRCFVCDEKIASADDTFQEVIIKIHKHFDIDPCIVRLEFKRVIFKPRVPCYYVNSNKGPLDTFENLLG